VSDVDGYLLDNNVISVLARPKDSRFTTVETRLKAVRPAPIMLPVIAIAEIEFGMAKAESPDPQQQAEVRAFFAKYPLHLGIDDNTVEPYALLRAQLWTMYGTKKKRGHAEKRPEELIDRITGKELGIDERDLLIGSVAAQYNLVLATLDQNEGMKRIEAAANELAKVGSLVQLRISYWT
jgi:predicted nucleic acid-binding protein